MSVSLLRPTAARFLLRRVLGPAAWGRHAAAAAALSTSAPGEVVPFLLADIGEGIAEVEVLQWFVAEGDSVQQFDRVCEVQSDKATVEISSRFDGVVAKVHFETGAMVPVGSALLDIATSGASQQAALSSSLEDEAPPATPPPTVAPPAIPLAAAPPAPPAAVPNTEVLTTPAVRKIAREHDVDLRLVPGTGPGGRILKHDVLDWVRGGQHASTVGTGDAAPDSSPTTAVGAPEAASRVEKIQGLQRMMVKKMNDALLVPHFNYGDEIVMDEMVQLRKVLKVLAAERGIKLSYLPIVLKATSLALRDYPILNASLINNATEIEFHGAHNLGVAMDTPRGLLVPNIKNVQDKSIFAIAHELQQLQEKGAAGKLGEEELAGGTFTISNIGTIGGNFMSPVIMVPQVAIGALGKIQTVPRLKHPGDTEATLLPVMQVSWAADHRIVDGATIARFTNTLKGFLEQPARLLADLK